MSLLEMSRTGGILILAIIVFRALTLNHLPKKTFLLLWWIALARLLLPFSLPSPYSIYSLFPSWAAWRTPDFSAEGSTLPWLDPHTASQTFLVEYPVSPLSFWGTLWLVGALLCGLFFAITYWHCCHRYRQAAPIQNTFIRSWLERHPLRRPLSIRSSTDISTPLTYGILHPVILLPQSIDWSQQHTLDYVLTHEYLHIRRWDALTKLLLTTALCVHWFNPMVWVMLALAGRDIELSCDESVVRQFGPTSRAAYAKALISMEEARCRPAPFCSGFSKNAMEERIVAIMKTKKTTVFALALSVFLVAGLVLVFATSSNATPYIASANNETLTQHTAFTPGVDDIEWWTAEEYEKWLEQEKQQLQALVGTGSGWYDSDGTLHLWTQEAVDECIQNYAQVLTELKAGRHYAKPLDSDGDGFPDLSLSMLTPETSADKVMTYSQDSQQTY